MLENGNSIVEALNNACNKIGARNDACSIAEGIENYSNGCGIKPEVSVYWDRTYRQVTGPNQLPYNETFTVKYKGIELHGVDSHDETVWNTIKELRDRITAGEIICATVGFGRNPMSCPSSSHESSTNTYQYVIPLGKRCSGSSHGWTDYVEGQVVIPSYYADDPDTHIPSSTDSGLTLFILSLFYGSNQSAGRVSGASFRFTPLTTEPTT